MSLWEITNQLESHFTSWENRGGDYAVHGRVERNLAAQHSLASGGGYGDPCAGCGNPWPCDVIWGIQAPE